MNYNINKSNNQVPKGYKKTKVGVIPEDWKVVKISELGSLTGGGTPNTKNKESWNGTIPWISSSDLTENSIYNIKISRYITEDSIQNSATKLVPKNSILIVSRVGVGKVAINKNDICTSQDFQNLTLKNDSTIFIAYLIKDKTKILISYNQGTSIKGFVKSDLKNLKIPLPPLKEQKKIANILTTWDDAISKQDKLIKSKEELKKGLMQKLLSGEVQFDGFNREWKNRKIEELVFYQEGPGVRRTQYTKSGVKLLNVGNLNNNELNLNSTDKYISENEAFGNYKHFLADEGDLLISCSGINSESFKKKIAFVKKEHLPLCMNTSTMRFKSLDNQLSLNYLNYFFQTLDFEKQVFKVLTGSAQFNFGPTHIKWFKIPLPSMKEQLKIDQILATIDKEIDLLKNELEELKKQKKGLMQKLLTGEVRVKV